MIIVGGRPAGATLAARLGEWGHRVLIVDRATFPSLPQVPSSPVLYPSGMQILDALGIPEADYGVPEAQMRRLIIEFSGEFSVEMPVPRMRDGRAYVYGLDRNVFDARLWRELERYPSVERREGFAVTDVLREGERVVGVEGGPHPRAGAAERERLSARWVVGADGRFSLIARKVGAEVTEARDQHTSTAYFADWEGIEPIDEGPPAGLVHTTARGLDVVFFAMPGGRVSINTHARSDRVDVRGDAERHYHETLRSLAPLRQRFARAERVTPVIGVKRIGNGYRRASGPGWALCGDAVHYKDPVDGQGIYDAFLGAELLAAAIDVALIGDATWEGAMASYARRLHEATHPMFVATTGRLARELYQEPPLAVIRTIIRWTLSDPDYQDTFLRVLSRELPPPAMTSKRVMARAVARGLRGELRRRLERALGRRDR